MAQGSVQHIKHINLYWLDFQYKNIGLEAQISHFFFLKHQSEEMFFVLFEALSYGNIFVMLGELRTLKFSVVLQPRNEEGYFHFY